MGVRARVKVRARVRARAGARLGLGLGLGPGAYEAHLKGPAASVIPDDHPALAQVRPRNASLHATALERRVGAQ